MKLSKRQFNAFLAGSALALPGSARAQGAFPNKPIRFVVGYVPGGGADILVRTVTDQLAKQIDQPIVVENKPGAGSSLAAEYVARSPADGYTLLAADTGTLVFNTALFKKLSYNPKTDLESVGMLAHYPLLLTASLQSGFTSARAAVDAIVQNPGKFGCASPGVGTPHHIALEVLKEEARLNLLHVSYRGAAPAIQDLAAGVVPFAVLDSASSAGMRAANKITVLATFTDQRASVLPDAPTLIELGVMKSSAPCWVSVAAPAGTPSDVVARLSSEISKAVASAPVQKRLRELGLEPQPSTPQQMKEVWLDADRKWPPLMRAKGISID
jgi:tripartite-type tricarboxylate transporter receptor subunit TctC